MAIGDSIQRYPLLRLFVPYACGIALGDTLYSVGMFALTSVAIAVSLMLVGAMLCVYGSRHATWRMVYGILASGVFLLLGVGCYSLSRDNISYGWPSEEHVYEARVVDSPRKRARSTLCMMQVGAMADSAGWTSVQRKVFVYMESTEAVDSLLPGDVVCFRGKVRKPQNFTDDLDFDYARYVTMQGVSGTVYLPSSQWKRVGEGHLTLRERLLRFRLYLQEHYMHSTFSDDALGVLAALTLGDKRLLSEETRAAYSDAGAAHVLALSGLHVGVIYAMLAFMISGVVRQRGMRWLRELLIIGVLWTFALMVGMSASVVRAVFMCTLYILARWISRDSSSISVLSLAAFVMLLAHPLYLFDVSFQLSFMAMAAILWLEPYVETFLHNKRLPWLLAYPIGIIGMSLVAQLGTFPLALYHFGTFPTCFLLTNLVVIPYLNIVLLLTVAWWTLVLLGVPLSNQLGQLLQHLTQWMNDCLAYIGQWPHAVLHITEYSAMATMFTYLLIFFLALYLTKKWPRGLVLALVSLLGLLVTYLF